VVLGADTEESLSPEVSVVAALVVAADSAVGLVAASVAAVQAGVGNA
jgi:hypothetical protein